MKTEKQVLEEYYDQILNIMDTIRVGVFITDGEGYVLMMNKESEKTGGLKAEEILGKNMVDLQAQGYVDESSVLMTLKKGEGTSCIQNLGDGGKIYIESVPYYKNGKIDLVVCTERDITETIRLKNLLDQSKQIAEKQKNELEYLREKSVRNTNKVIAQSPIMKKIISAVSRIARLDTTVLITGESGTGKEVIADYIFRMSTRTEKPYIKINCAAIPENLLESELFGYEKGAFTGADVKGKIGIFELAHGGTLFLDEIAEVPIRLQAKLLRVLQEKEIMRIGGKDTIPVDVRIIAATNIDLKKAVEEGYFREDLYYRLNIIPVEIPPLRDRKEDIESLSRHFVDTFYQKYNIKKTVSQKAIEELKKAYWPGNIRELRNVIERAVVSFDGEQITLMQIKSLINNTRDKGEKRKNSDVSLGQLLEKYEREILAGYLEECPSASEAARKLHIDKSTISRKMKKYGLNGE